jgi:hypothetical protein
MGLYLQQGDTPDIWVNHQKKNELEEPEEKPSFFYTLNYLFPIQRAERLKERNGEPPLYDFW